jgi:DNA-binding transcriptional LysR family regulator
MSFDARVLAGVSVLAAVTEAGSFARAAEALGVTPSGVSRAVARLEQRVKVRLFNRTSRAVTLTEEGRRFHAQVLPLLASIEDAATEIAGAAATVSGRLRVNVDPWFARMVLAPRLSRFMKQHPLLSLETIVSNHREDMMNGVDVAVRFGPADDSSLIARKLLDTRVLTCAAPAYLKKHGVPLTPHDLSQHEAVLFRDPLTGRAFPWGFTRKGKEVDVEIRGRFTTDDPSTAIATCVAGQGVFQSLELGLGAWLRTGRLVQVLSDWAEERYPLYAYHHSRRHPPAKVRAFLDFVKEIAADEAASCAKA